MRIVLWLALALMSFVISSRIFVDYAPAWIVMLTAIAIFTLAMLAYRFRAVLLSRRHVLISVAVVSYLSAWNRGLPVMYAFSAVFISLWLMGMLTPHLTLRQILAQRAHNPSAFEGESLAMNFVLHNTGNRAARLIEIRDFAIGKTVMTLVARLLPGQRKEVEYALPCPHRGVYAIGPVRLASGFPLGLATKEIDVPNSLSTLWVYPRLYPVGNFPLYGEKRQSWRGVPSPRAGVGDDFAGVREYRVGDSPRHIHWRASAKHGELVVKEFERRSVTTVTIFLDLESRNLRGIEGETTLDYAARITASIARHALHQGHSVQLAGIGKERLFLESVEGPDAMEPVLSALAAANADGDTPFHEAVAGFSRLVPEQSSAVLVPTLLPGTALSSALAALQQRGVFCVTVALDGQSFTGATVSQDTISHQLGGAYYHIRRGDDLGKVFTA